MTKPPPADPDHVDQARAAMRDQESTAEQLTAVKALLDAAGSSLALEIAGQSSRLDEILARDAPNAANVKAHEDEEARQSARETRAKQISLTSKQLEERIAAQLRAEREIRREAKRAVAEAGSNSFEYRSIVEAVLASLGQVHANGVAAEAAIADANEDLPEGATPLPAIDADRYLRRLPGNKRVTSSVLCWTNIETGQLATATEAQRIGDDGIFRLGSFKRVGGERKEWTLRECRREETYEYYWPGPGASRGVTEILAEVTKLLEEILVKAPEQPMLRASPSLTKDVLVEPFVRHEAAALAEPLDGFIGLRAVSRRGG